jgi:hypothetical protein
LSAIAAGLVVTAMVTLSVMPGCSGPSGRYWNGKPPTQPSTMPALPAPAVIPGGEGVSGGPGWLALQLAAANSGAAERPLVLAAINASGFSVEGGPATTGARMGGPFTPWEVDLLADLEGTHVRLPAGDIALAIDRAVPGLGGAAAESVLIGVVRDQAGQPAGTTGQFWAQLITALGAAAPEPYDLASADPSAISLDGSAVRAAIAQRGCRHGGVGAWSRGDLRCAARDGYSTCLAA